MEPERLSPDDLAYHARVVEQRQAAIAVEQSWAAHVAAKYGLRPGEHVDQDGVLHRAPKAPD